MRALSLPVAGIVALLLVVAGCGGSGSSGSASSTTTSGAATEATTPATTATTAASGDLTECVQLAASLGQAVQAVGGGLPGSSLSDAATALESAAKVVPSDIRGDFQIWANAFATFAASYGKLNLQSGAVPSAADIAKLTEAAKVFDTPEVKTAQQNLENWSNQHCNAG